MNSLTLKKSFKILSILVFFTLLFSINGCNKEKTLSIIQPNAIIDNGGLVVHDNNTMTKIMSIAKIRLIAESNTNQVMFNENAQVFEVKDMALLNNLRTNFSNNTKVKVTFDPWQAQVLSISPLTVAEAQVNISKVYNGKSGAHKVDFKTMTADEIDNLPKFGVVNTTVTNLVNVVPDMATAQLMFNFISTQCCKIPGPYAIDYCISFQYAPDGCYARAHKMCDILNNKYHYDTHKIFSFANAGSDVLCVQAQKWGGCCVNWWYHVAPLVNIKTPTGVKAFVFDPAMFNQPVLLSQWLHAQENPACAAGVPNVSMINVQPTAMYAPSDWSGFSFMTDPGYSDTNATLVAYASLSTCP